jgi:hypothetical protein
MHPTTRTQIKIEAKIFSACRRINARTAADDTSRSLKKPHGRRPSYRMSLCNQAARWPHARPLLRVLSGPKRLWRRIGVPQKLRRRSQSFIMHVMSLQLISRNAHDCEPLLQGIFLIMKLSPICASRNNDVVFQQTFACDCISIKLVPCRVCHV